jgi:hypothetical protein
MMRLMQSTQPRKKRSGERELRQGGIQGPRTKVEATTRAVQESLGEQEGIRTRSGLHSQCAGDISRRERRPGVVLKARELEPGTNNSQARPGLTVQIETSPA